jgi:hypothetical protein
MPKQVGTPFYQTLKRSFFKDLKADQRSFFVPLFEGQNFKKDKTINMQAETRNTRPPVSNPIM